MKRRVAIDRKRLRWVRAAHARREAGGGADIVGEDASVCAGAAQAVEADAGLPRHARRQRGCTGIAAVARTGRAGLGCLGR